MKNEFETDQLVVHPESLGVYRLGKLEHGENGETFRYCALEGKMAGQTAYEEDVKRSKLSRQLTLLDFRKLA